MQVFRYGLKTIPRHLLLHNWKWKEKDFSDKVIFTFTIIYRGVGKDKDFSFYFSDKVMFTSTISYRLAKIRIIQYMSLSYVTEILIDTYLHIQTGGWLTSSRGTMGAAGFP